MSDNKETVRCKEPSCGWNRTVENTAAAAVALLVHYQRAHKRTKVKW